MLADSPASFEAMDKFRRSSDGRFLVLKIAQSSRNPSEFQQFHSFFGFFYVFGFRIWRLKHLRGRVFRASLFFYAEAFDFLDVVAFRIVARHDKFRGGMH